MPRPGNCTMIQTMRTVFVAVVTGIVLVLAACGPGGDESEAAAFADFADERVAPAAPAAAPAPAAPALSSRPSIVSGAPDFDFGLKAPAAPAPAATAGRVAGGAPSFSEEAVAEVIAQQRIIVRTVDLQLEVTDVPSALDAVADLAEEVGGWTVSSNRSRKHRGSISVRVPAARLDEAVLRLRKIAVDVESEVSTSQDVTDEYVDLTARLQNLQATERALLTLLDRAEQVEDALKVQQSLTQVQGDIESLQGRIKLLEQTSAFSLINVGLELESAEMFVNAGEDQTAGVGEFVRFRAFFKPPEGIDEFLVTWDFGDGSRIITTDRTAPTADEDTRVTATVTHQYHDDRDSPFFADVEIKGTGEAGVAEGRDILIVTVTRVPTVQVFAGESVIVEEDEEVQFSGSFTRPEGVTGVEYAWDFGDGSQPVTSTAPVGVTVAEASHVYADHRPFPYTATLTITAQSDAGEVEASGALSVRVLKGEGWVIAGWSLGNQGKTAVRTLSAVGQGIATALIWVAIFSPAWAVAVLVAVLSWRRIRGRAPRAARGPEPSPVPSESPEDPH